MKSLKIESEVIDMVMNRLYEAKPHKYIDKEPNPNPPPEYKYTYPGDGDGRQKGKEEPGQDVKGSEKDDIQYLKDLDIELPPGLSDGEIKSIVKTDQQRRKFLSSTVDLMIEHLEQTKSGAGARDMTRDQWQALKNFAEGKGPKIPQYNVTESDIDDTIQIIKESGVKKVMTFLQNKGAAGEGSTRKGTEDDPGPGWGRDRKMLESFLKCGGISAVTGKPLSIGTSNVDHRLSLDNGGKDEPDNWIWMETEINMNKSALNDKDLLKKSKEALAKSPDELKKKKLKNLIKNETKDFATDYYKKMFKRGGNGGITEDILKKSGVKDIKRMIYGWNALYDKSSGLNIKTYIQQVGGSRAGETGLGGRGVPLSKGLLIKSAIEQFNKKQQVLSSTDIAKMNKIFEDGIEKIETQKV